MRALKHSRIAVPLISIAAVFAVAAQAQEPNPREHQKQHAPTGQAPRTGAPGAHPAVAPRTVQGTVQGQVRGSRGPQGRANFQVRNFGGHPYRGRMAWEGGRWRHEMHNGRYGWWWDVGGVWYFYPQPMDGPPAYVSDVEVMDDAYAGGPDDMVDPGPGYPPPVAYAPPPPPPDPAASAVGGAVVGGLLGGLLTGRPVGAAVGAITGGTIGAIAGAEAAARPGYYLAQGNCYYKYPSGQYAQVDPRNCY